MTSPALTMLSIPFKIALALITSSTFPPVNSLVKYSFSVFVHALSMSCSSVGSCDSDMDEETGITSQPEYFSRSWEAVSCGSEPRSEATS